MNDTPYLTKEETLLTPHETQISIEAWLTDCKYIDKKNYEGCYSISFSPATDSDYARLEEQISNAVTQVEFRKSPDSRKIPDERCVNKDGSFYTSQLYLPICNVEYYFPEDLKGELASLNLHLRDSPTGEVFLQVGYVDLYNQVKPDTDFKTAFQLEEEANPTPPNEIDEFDW